MRKFEKGEEINLNIDEEYRIKHAKLHSAGHLLGMAVDRAGHKDWKCKKGYFFEDNPKSEF